MDLFLSLIQEIKKTTIQIAVLNGVDLVERRLGRDVDLLINRNDLETIVDLCRLTANKKGWGYVVGRWVGSWYPKGLFQVVFHRVDGHRVTHLAFDLISAPGIGAGFVALYGPDLLDENVELVEGVPFTPIGAFMKNGVLKVLAGQEKGFRWVERAVLSTSVREHLGVVLGRRWTRSFLRAIESGTLQKEWRGLRRMAQVSYFLRRPIKAVGNGWKSMIRRSVGRALYPTPRVMILGSGASAVREGLLRCDRILGGAFVHVVKRQVGQGACERGAGFRGRVQAAAFLTGPCVEALKAENWGPVKFAFAWAVYAFGVAFRDRGVDAAELPVVVYEVLGSDLGAQQWDSAKWPPRLVRLLHRWSPRPEIVVLLVNKGEGGGESDGGSFHLGYYSSSRSSTKSKAEMQVDEVVMLADKDSEEVGMDIAKAIFRSLEFYEKRGIESG